MLARTDLRGRTPSTAELRAALPRGGVDVDAVLHQVRPMVEAVRDRGAEAALEFVEKFDVVRPASVRVPAAELERAL
ncbi:histidinol dehydrogenase, partial [Halomonas sp. ND22Bw]